MKYNKPILYDFGPKENLKRYGQTEPPSFNLSSIKSHSLPISMFAMKHDRLVNVNLSRKIRDELGSSI